MPLAYVLLPGPCWCWGWLSVAWRQLYQVRQLVACAVVFLLVSVAMAIVSAPGRPCFSPNFCVRRLWIFSFVTGLGVGALQRG